MKKNDRQNLFSYLVIFLFLFFPLHLALAQEEGVLPDWVQRVEYSFQLESDKKPIFYFQTVQPLYQNKDKVDTIFLQPRISLKEERTLYNLGLGYRKLASENLILGTNFFGDYQELHHHGRLGVGLEALGQIWEGRVNAYFGGITNKQEVEVSGASTTTERVANGVDCEIGAPFPYAPGLKLYGSGFWFDFKDFNDKEGWKSRLEATLNKNLKLEVYTWDDNKGDLEYGGRLRFNIVFNAFSDVLRAMKFSEEPFPKKDLKKELLIPVERQFEITVEKKIQSNGFTVEGGRS